MPKTFLVSDASINTYRCRVFLAGLDTTAFESNPVMLFMHLRGNVIGKWENLKRVGDKLFADAVFDLEDGKMGAEIGGKVEREFLKAASIGIVILEASYNEELDCYDITKCYLQEISIVDIGSNHNALQLYDKTGEPISELKLASHLEQFKPATTTTISTDQPIMEMKLATIAIALGLAATATEQEVLTLAANSVGAANELAQLKLTLKANQENEATSLVDMAISEHRIPATSKDVYLKLFAADHDSAKLALASLQKPANLVQFAQQSQVSQVVATDADAAKKYDEMDKAGTLINLKSQNPDEFKRLYKAKFGSEPDKVFA